MSAAGSVFETAVPRRHQEEAGSFSRPGAAEGHRLQTPPEIGELYQKPVPLSFEDRGLFLRPDPLLPFPLQRALEALAVAADLGDPSFPLLKLFRRQPPVLLEGADPGFEPQVVLLQRLDLAPILLAFPLKGASQVPFVAGEGLFQSLKESGREGTRGASGGRLLLQLPQDPADTRLPVPRRSRMARKVGACSGWSRTGG